MIGSISNDIFWRNFSCQLYLLSTFLSEVCWEEHAEEIFLHNFVWDVWSGVCNLTYNKPTHYLLEYGDCEFFIKVNLVMAIFPCEVISKCSVFQVAVHPWTLAYLLLYCDSYLINSEFSVDWFDLVDERLHVISQKVVLWEPKKNGSHGEFLAFAHVTKSSWFST